MQACGRTRGMSTVACLVPHLMPAASVLLLEAAIAASQRLRHRAKLIAPLPASLVAQSVLDN